MATDLTPERLAEIRDAAEFRRNALGGPMNMSPDVALLLLDALDAANERADLNEHMLAVLTTPAEDTQPVPQDRCGCEDGGWVFGDSKWWIDTSMGTYRANAYCHHCRCELSIGDGLQPTVTRMAPAGLDTRRLDALEGLLIARRGTIMPPDDHGLVAFDKDGNEQARCIGTNLRDLADELIARAKGGA